MTASAMAWEFRKGTIIPLPSAKTSFAYKYGVEIHILPAPIAYAKAPEADCCGSKYGVIYMSITFNQSINSSKDIYSFINFTFSLKLLCFIFSFRKYLYFSHSLCSTTGCVWPIIKYMTLGK